MNVSKIASVFATAFFATSLWFGVANEARAATIEISSAGIYSGNTVTLGGKSGQLASAILLTTATGDAIWVFCVDIDHDITVSVGSQHSFNPALNYIANSVTTNSSTGSGTGGSITLQQSTEIQYLANLGLSMASQTATATVQNQSTAIQAAIWNIEYGLGSDGLATAKVGLGDSLAGGQSYAAENALIQSYEAQSMAGAGVAYATGIYSTNGNGQLGGTSQGFVVAGVPEPATWGMMLLGFAFVGFLGYRLQLLARIV